MGMRKIIEKEAITRDQILEFLTFRDGDFFWKSAYTNAVKVGDKAGHKRPDGYTVINLLGHTYRAHRLAWVVAFNEPSPEIIDHINGVRSDNRPENLRSATRSENALNTGPRSRNKSGFKGVHRHYDGRWRAQFRFKGKRYCLGVFDTPEEAHAAYISGAAKTSPDFANGGDVGI